MYHSVEMFVIDDENHAEQWDGFDSFDGALEQLKKWASEPWDEKQNRAPCTGWRSCGRKYLIVEYNDGSGRSWKQLSRVPVLEVSAAGSRWIT